jgi:hypothetical protein
LSDFVQDFRQTGSIFPEDGLFLKGEKKMLFTLKKESGPQ